MPSLGRAWNKYWNDFISSDISMPPSGKALLWLRCSITLFTYVCFVEFELHHVAQDGLKLLASDPSFLAFQIRRLQGVGVGVRAHVVSSYIGARNQIQSSGRATSAFNPRSHTGAGDLNSGPDVYTISKLVTNHPQPCFLRGFDFICRSVFLHARRCISLCGPYFGGQKRLSDSLELKLQMVMNHHVSPGNQT